MADTIDLNQIAVLLTRAAHNYNELARNWNDIFFNRTPIKEIPLYFYNDNGEINKDPYIIPNRAYDMRFILNGEGKPDEIEDEGPKGAPLGSIYQDIKNGELYIKKVVALNGTETGVWQKFDNLTDHYIFGDHKPDDDSDWAPIGTLYTDTTTGYLYTMTNKGWAQAGASGFATISWVQSELDKLNNEIEGGVVHITEDEIIGGNKTFTGTTTFDNELSAEKDCTFKGAITFEDICNFQKVIMGTAYRALSADIAEFYEADEYIEPGTLVMFGGDKEITKADKSINAVVSTNPAYILNDNKTMEFPTLIALSGRIPVRVKGPVHKFDYIILSDEKGIGVAVDKADKPCYNVVGRALEDNLNEEEKLVECIVKLEL